VATGMVLITISFYIAPLGIIILIGINIISAISCLDFATFDPDFKGYTPFYTMAVFVWILLLFI